MKRCIAKKVFTLTHDAPSDEAFIEFADAHSQNNDGGGLDSLDTGDSMGWFCQYLESEEWSGDCPDGQMILVSPEGFSVTIGYDWELYQWDDGNGPNPNTLMNMIIEKGITKESIERKLREFPELVCEKCGETFIPADENDTIHIADANGDPCGGEGK